MQLPTWRRPRSPDRLSLLGAFPQLDRYLSRGLTGLLTQKTPSVARHWRLSNADEGRDDVW